MVPAFPDFPHPASHTHTNTHTHTHLSDRDGALSLHVHGIARGSLLCFHLFTTVVAPADGGGQGMQVFFGYALGLFWLCVRSLL
jgi:hypothetical protein